jgi:ankyrin repeat protein
MKSISDIWIDLLKLELISTLWTWKDRLCSGQLVKTSKWNIAEQLNYLTQHGINLNHTHYRGRSIIHDLVSSPNTDKQLWLVDWMLDHGCSPNIRDQRGQIPLHLAATEVRADKLVAALTKAGSIINIADKTGTTPAHAAAWSGNLKVLNLLINAGADLNAQDEYGKTPLHIAAKDQPEDILEAMIGRMSDTTAKDRFGMTAQDVAELNDRSDNTLQILQPRKLGRLGF